MAEADRRNTKRREPASEEHDPRSVAQLKMLHSLAAKLNRLNDVQQIGEVVTAELRTLIDYHNCRIYLLQPDGESLVPIVFRGELTEYQSETYEELITKVGEGFTGHSAATGETYYAPDALHDDIGIQIEGTPEVEESILCVPLKYGEKVNGVIVLSNLGIDKFDEGDERLLEVLASHAAVAFENARLFQMEREAAQTSSALLGLSQALTGVHDTEAALERVVAAVPAILGTGAIAVYVQDPETGAFQLAAHRGADPDLVAEAESTRVDPETASRFLRSIGEPFVLPQDVVASVPREYHLLEDMREALIAPLRWDPDGFGALVMIAGEADEGFTPRDVRLARGIADIASLALGSARRFHELERFHELVESLEAIFWEADPVTQEFTFLSHRAALILGREMEEGMGEPQSWGDHTHPEDRETALAAFRSAIEEGGDHSLEYRAIGREGETIWLRDLVHVARDAQRGARQIRDLMVDITERKRAEQALRKSERKYSEAFKREREATQRLRALDDMKNTFLQAVSHDLRTPLTSILGSALTLEQAGPTVSPEDSYDLVRRIAANARKLERLLSDLLDLDRLQRGIVSPQRRPTDIGALVRQAVDESDLAGDREIEIDADRVVVSVDPAKVERIIENLLANATRHTPAGTHLWIRARAQDGGVLLAVEDEGPGVPKDLRDAVFEPFRQGPGQSTHSPGVGVGLSLVGRFAELHGGRAWVEERPGGGASFKVFLPAG